MASLRRVAKTLSAVLPAALAGCASAPPPAAAPVEAAPVSVACPGAGSTFRQGGGAVRAAAEDTERLRGIFLQHVAVPESTVLHGQSWGASVAAKAAEMFTGTTTGSF